MNAFSKVETLRRQVFDRKFEKFVLKYVKLTLAKSGTESRDFVSGSRIDRYFVSGLAALIMNCVYCNDVATAGHLNRCVTVFMTSIADLTAEDVPLKKKQLQHQKKMLVNKYNIDVSSPASQYTPEDFELLNIAAVHGVITDKTTLTNFFNMVMEAHDSRLSKRLFGSLAVITQRNAWLFMAKLANMITPKVCKDLRPEVLRFYHHYLNTAMELHILIFNNT